MKNEEFNLTAYGVTRIPDSYM